MHQAIYIRALKEILYRYGLDVDVTDDDLSFFDQIVTDVMNHERPLTARLTKAISPPIYSGEFYHYSKPDAVNAILRSKILRLTSLKKRVNENEIESFLRDFGFEYPLQIDPDTGKPRYLTTIAGEVFYISFTDISLAPEEENYFWDNFAGSDGARLKFRINIGSGCLRRMVYGNAIAKWSKFFREVNELTENQLGKIFFWGDSAIVCALHLPDSYKIERETRLITRRNCGLPMGVDNDLEYFELFFGYNESIKANISLVEIQTDQPVVDPGDAIVTSRT